MFKKISEKLQQRRDRLVSSFIHHREPAFVQENAKILDSYFRESYEKSIVGPQMALGGNPYALVALGGYGRGEQCVHSDIDLLFLFKAFVPEEAGGLVREVVYPLWDLGFEVGYSTLSLSECIDKAGENFGMLIPLIDARFICGMSLLYSDLMENLNTKIIQSRSKKIISWLVQQSRERHLHFGDSSYLLEPNLKEGQGGLRDYHTILWITRVLSSLKQSRDLEYDGYLTHEEYRKLLEAISFIWRVRNRLHHIAGRKCDQLYFEHQIKLADELKYKRKHGQHPVERFLGDLHGQMEFVKQQHLIFFHEQGFIKKRNRRINFNDKIKIQSLNVKNNMLNFSSAGKILKSPILLLHIFEESARLNLPLSVDAKRLVREFSYLAERRFINSNAAVESFEKILMTPVPTFNVLNEMMNTGFLTCFIPEMKAIENRIQYDEYHLYPVDKHSLRTVQTLKHFSVSSESTDHALCGKLYKGLKNKKLLLWAALLHDIGKGREGGDHSSRGSEMVRSILAAKKLKAEDIETVIFLVKEHLTLIKIATRRDIHDEETAISCARQIKEATRLKMLYLLTVADSMSTGPKAWNSWTSSLLSDFFMRVLGIIEKGELASQKAVKIVETKKEQILSLSPANQKREALEKIFDFMSPRYLLYTPADDIREHVKLYRKMNRKDFVWNVAVGPEPNTRQVTICAKDRPGLISKISGVLTLNMLDILDVKVYTWRNNIALDIFIVKPPPDQIFEDEKWRHAQKDLASALSGGLDLTAALGEMMSVYGFDKPQLPATRPSKIEINNHSSSFFTIIEVFAYDFPGLLFRITDALFRCKLDVWVAKIATKVDQVVDVFYVRDFDGQKIDSPEQVSAIKAVIAAILPVF